MLWHYADDKKKSIMKSFNYDLHISNIPDLSNINDCFFDKFDYCFPSIL